MRHSGLFWKIVRTWVVGESISALPEGLATSSGSPSSCSAGLPAGVEPADHMLVSWKAIQTGSKGERKGRRRV